MPLHYIYILISCQRVMLFFFPMCPVCAHAFLSRTHSLFLFVVSLLLICSWSFVIELIRTVCLFTLNPVRPDVSSHYSSVIMKNVGCKRCYCRNAMLKQLDDVDLLSTSYLMSGLLFLSALASKYPEYSLSNPVCGCEMWFSSITSLFIIQIKKILIQTLCVLSYSAGLSNAGNILSTTAQCLYVTLLTAFQMEILYLYLLIT